MRTHTYQSRFLKKEAWLLLLELYHGSVHSRRYTSRINWSGSFFGKRQKPLPLTFPHVNFSWKARMDFTSVPQRPYVILFSRFPFEFSFILFLSFLQTRVRKEMGIPVTKPWRRLPIRAGPLSASAEWGGCTEWLRPIPLQGPLFGEKEKIVLISNWVCNMAKNPEF